MTENNKEEKFVTLIHRDADVFTLTEFMNKEMIYEIEPKDLFEINREFIWLQMNKETLSSYAEGTAPKSSAELKLDMSLPRPCNLNIPAKNVKKELLISQTNLQTSEDVFLAFADENIQKSFLNNFTAIVEENNSYSKNNYNCTVLIYCKALNVNLFNGGVVMGDKLLDVSDHIVGLNTFVDKNGGNFKIKLPFITKDRQNSTVGLNKDPFFYEIPRIQDNLSSYKKSDFNTNIDYFSNVVQNNDLVFIKFDKINRKDESIQIEASDLPNENFDMIALVDNISVNKSAQNSDVSVDISGRDLMKLLIDDSSNFFQVSTTNSPESIFCNTHSFGDASSVDKTGKGYPDPIKRVRRLVGEIDVFSNRTNMSISFILKGVISQLANIEIIDNAFFDSWGSKRTTFKELTPIKK